MEQKEIKSIIDVPLDKVLGCFQALYEMAILILDLEKKDIDECNQVIASYNYESRYAPWFILDPLDPRIVGEILAIVPKWFDEIEIDDSV